MNLQTTPDFWDCECITDYIKPRRQEYCGKCHTARIGQPDSRQNEVERLHPHPSARRSLGEGDPQPKPQPQPQP